jgi:hypothetical protein
MRTSLIAVFALALCLFAPAAPAQQEFASESKSWKFTVPDGWNMIGFEVTKGIEARMREQDPDRPTTYLVGFTKGGMNTLVYPRVLVATAKVDMTGVMVEDIEAGLAGGAPTSELDEARKLFVRDAGIHPGGSLDTSRMRAITTVSKTNEKGEAVKVKVYAYIGKSQVIRFECSDLESNGENASGSFEQLAGSFSFRDDAKFVPAASSEGGPFDGLSDESYRSQSRSTTSSGGYRYRRFGVGGLVVLVVGGILALIFRD